MSETETPEGVPTTPAPAAAPAKPKPKRTRAERRKPVGAVHMTARDIVTARAMREKEGWTIEAIASHFRKHPSSIRKLFKRLDIKKGARVKEVQERVEKKMDEEIITDAIIRTRRIKETREDHYSHTKMLEKLLVSEIVEMKKSGGDISSLINNVKTYVEAIKGLRLGQEVRFLSLGIKDGDDPEDENLPDLTLTELTAEEIAMIQANTDQGDVLDIDGEGPPSEENGVVNLGDEEDDE
jgi:hypothetical protein